ncbi:MAG: hypothetical protein JNM55_13355 [Anaerolineales bacterium]|nr:hypothetical protein [Anaerolineales bacterium]
MNPKNQNNRISNLLEHITDLLYRTWSAFLVAKHLDAVIDAPEYAPSRYFLSSVYGACIESAILGFSKLMSNTKNEISILYLLELVSRESAHSAVSYREELQSFSQTHKQQLLSMQPLVDNIKIWRDKAIAHSDRIHINNPSAIVQAEMIDMDDPGLELMRLQDLINFYRQEFGLGNIRLQEAETKMASEWRHLEKLLKENDYPGI